MDPASRPSNTLPSISHLDVEHMRPERSDVSRFDLSRFSIGSGLSISTAPLASPTASMYSGPPAPYSCAPSTAGSASGLSGYISPPESTTRRSTRDDQESPDLRKSLPSIHEALADKSMVPFPNPLPGSSQHNSLPTPSTAVAPSFSEGPKGPVNPFSQPATMPSIREVLSGPPNPVSTPTEVQMSQPAFPPASTPDPRQPVSQHFGYPGSPRSQPSSAFRSSALINTSFANPNEVSQAKSPTTHEPPRQLQQMLIPTFGNPSTSVYPATSEPYHFAAGPKPDDLRGSSSKPSNDGQYSENVKRAIDVYSVEMGLNEISEASSRTLDFARIWSQRHQEGGRSGQYYESLPGLQEIDDMTRSTNRMLENLHYIREVVVTQQTALSEQRARLARGPRLDDEYSGLSDEYKNGAYVGGDPKKRRGKAAPPGRCHSCNRAETPEWRRGPDGARTLCNACGLHYAKLTRKMGVNKAAALTGSTLRPRLLESARR